MKKQLVQNDINHYHNMCISDVIKIGSYIKNIGNNPESNVYTFIEQCINNIKVFDEILKSFSIHFRRLCKFDDLSVEMIISLSNYLNTLTDLFNSIKFQYIQPCILQYSQFEESFQYKRYCFEKLVDFVEFSLSYFKEMHINLLKIILSK